MSFALSYACTRQLVLVVARLVSGSSVMTVGALCGASWPPNAPKSKKKLGLSETERVIFCGCALLLFWNPFLFSWCSVCMCVCAGNCVMSNTLLLQNCNVCGHLTERLVTNCPSTITGNLKTVTLPILSLPLAVPLWRKWRLITSRGKTEAIKKKDSILSIHSRFVHCTDSVHSVKQELLLPGTKTVCGVTRVVCSASFSCFTLPFTAKTWMSVYNEGNVTQETCAASYMKHCCHVFVLSRQVCLMFTIVLWLKSDDGWIIEIRKAKSDECRKYYL